MLIDNRYSKAKTIKISPDGLYLLDDNTHGKYDPPQCLLKLPYKSGQTWEERYVSKGGRTWSVRNVSKDSEKVVTPSGEYNAIPVVSTYISGDIKLVITKWYSKGIGLIREDINGDTADLLKEFKKPGN